MARFHCSGGVPVQYGLSLITNLIKMKNLFSEIQEVIWEKCSGMFCSVLFYIEAYRLCVDDLPLRRGCPYRLCVDDGRVPTDHAGLP